MLTTQLTTEYCRLYLANGKLGCWSMKECSGVWKKKRSSITFNSEAENVQDTHTNTHILTCFLIRVWNYPLCQSNLGPILPVTVPGDLTSPTDGWHEMLLVRGKDAHREETHLIKLMNRKIKSLNFKLISNWLMKSAKVYFVVWL